MAEIKNLDELMSKLEKLSKMKLDETLNKACILVENEAKLTCPVKNNQLRASITHEVEGTTGVIGTNLVYAPFVEYGTGIYAAKGDGSNTPWSYQDAEGNWYTTVGMRPQPFLEPALQSSMKDILQLFEKAIKEEVT